MDRTQQGISGAGTVAVLHFFSERTDGVSLQIHENDRVLRERGWTVVECSADAAGPDGFIIPELDYTTTEVLSCKIRTSEENESEVEEDFEAQVQALKSGLEGLIQQRKPQVIHVRNAMSLPIHPAATVALAECIAAHPEVGFLTQHHDFSFEDDFVPGDRQKAYALPYPGLQKRVEQALLYTAPNVQHAVINSLMQKRLLAMFGLSAEVIPDSFDFQTQTLEIPDLRARLGIGENDLLIGTMARIIPRKAMEVGAQFIAELQKRKEEFLGAGRGVGGRTITNETRFLLLLPQAAGLDEPANLAYFDTLRKYAQGLGVEVLYIGDRVVADNAYQGEVNRLPFYSLYNAIDMLLFPSYQEGFGNQFLEAVALGRGLVACHAYPVMEADILPRISRSGIIYLGTNDDYTLDDDGLVHLREDILAAAAEQAIYFLNHPAEERAAATKTRQQLQTAFDSQVVGGLISDLLIKTINGTTAS